MMSYHLPIDGEKHALKKAKDAIHHKLTPAVTLHHKDKRLPEWQRKSLEREAKAALWNEFADLTEATDQYRASTTANVPEHPIKEKNHNYFAYSWVMIVNTWTRQFVVTCMLSTNITKVGYFGLTLLFIYFMVLAGLLAWLSPYANKAITVEEVIILAIFALLCACGGMLGFLETDKLGLATVNGENLYATEIKVMGILSTTLLLMLIIGTFLITVFGIRSAYKNAKRLLYEKREQNLLELYLKLYKKKAGFRKYEFSTATGRGKDIGTGGRSSKILDNDESQSQGDTTSKDPNRKAGKDKRQQTKSKDILRGIHDPYLGVALV